jgi:hypothetical protein
MKVGFTGTRTGMSVLQRNSLLVVLTELGMTELHHGDCKGSDAQCHALARREFERGTYKIVIHPPIVPTHRAFCIGNEERPKKDYLLRDHDIVDETEVLVATPEKLIETLRSGTWATVRYARSQKRRIIVIWPNGTIADLPAGSTWKGMLQAGVALNNEYSSRPQS